MHGKSKEKDTKYHKILLELNKIELNSANLKLSWNTDIYRSKNL